MAGQQAPAAWEVLTSPSEKRAPGADAALYVPASLVNSTRTPSPFFQVLSLAPSAVSSRALVTPICVQVSLVADHRTRASLGISRMACALAEANDVPAANRSL